LLTGVWKEGKVEGKGEFVGADGRVYSGEFKNDKKHGNGVLRWPDGKFIIFLRIMDFIIFL